MRVMRETSLATLVVEDLPAARRSLRVALVTETFPPEINGVATTVARVVNGLRERNHELQLIRPRQDADGDLEQAPRFHEVLMRGLPIPRYSNLRMGLPAANVLKAHWTVHRPDVVHIATEGPLGWSALRTALRLRVPVTSDFRTNFHAYSKHYGVGWLHKPIMAYLRKFHNQCHSTMVPTEQLRRALMDDGFRNLAVVARGVDVRLFGPHRRSEALRRSWGAGPNTLVVVHVGRLAPEKNLGVVVEAFEAMRAVNRDMKLVLVGDGPSRKTLQARCPDAIFAGMRSGEDLATHYASGDVFVFPSLTETFGNVTPEAMASGLPVLAFNYAAAAELIRPGHNGVLAPVDDTSTFVRRAKDLADQRPLLQRMGASAREKAVALSWDRVIEHVESVLVSAIHVGPAMRRAELVQA